VRNAGDTVRLFEALATTAESAHAELVAGQTELTDAASQRWD
jgi:hypothetical protein